MGRVSGMVLALAGLVALAAGWRLGTSSADTEAVAGLRVSATPAATQQRNVLHPVPDAAVTPADPARFGRWLNERSSLRGTDLDGSWDVDGQGRFEPTLALRRRFDQLLTLVGETPLEHVTAFIEHDVRELAGAPAAAAVLDAWQRYVELQRQPARSTVRVGDSASVAVALAERQQLRRRILGTALAQAFFAEDEARLQALVRGAGPAGEPQDTHIDRAQLDPEALSRLRAEEAAWADWQRRLGAARQEIQALQAAPGLSALQRAEAIERLIAQRFDAQEAVRVRALLHLPSAS